MATKMTLCASHAPGMDRDAAGELGTQFRAGVAQARAAIADFAPELVVLFGGDHRRAFAEVAPTFAVAQTASLLPEGAIPAEDLNVPSDLARELAYTLVAADFDIAVCRGVALDHAFGQPLHHYLPQVAGAQIIPIPVNCASPPLATATRTIAFGRAVGEFFDRVDKRILFIGTGGLSHSPPSLEDDRHDKTEEERRAQIQAGFEAASKKIKPDWDTRFLNALSRWDEAELVRMADRATEDAGVGANEVRTWLAAGAAGGGVPVVPLAYEPVETWITGMGVAVSAAA